MPEIIEVIEDNSGLCREILAELPEWFGLPDTVKRYATKPRI